MKSKATKKPRLRFARLFGHRGDQIHPAVNPHIPDLRLVRNSAKGNHGPVLELERREYPQSLLRPRQVTDHKSPAIAPKGLIFPNVAHVPKPFRHDPAGRGGNVYPDPSIVAPGSLPRPERSFRGQHLLLPGALLVLRVRCGSRYTVHLHSKRVRRTSPAEDSS